MSCVFAALAVGLLPASSLAQPTGPEIDVIPDSLEFSSTQIGSSTSGSFAIINLGFDNLVVSGIAVTSGSDFSVDFGLTAAYCETSTPVIPGFDQEPGSVAERCAVRVRFTPSAVGISMGEVTISSNDADEPDFVVSLQGTGVAAPVAEIDVDPVYIDFMTIGVGTSLTREITVSNAGPDALLVGPTTLSNWVDFSLDAYGGPSPCGLAGAVAAGSSCSMTVTFAPTTTDPVSALLTIASNDQDEPTVDVALFGNRTDPIEDCFNSIDDDGDGRIDCADPDCGDVISCNTHPCWTVDVVDDGDECVDIAVDDAGYVHLVYFVPSSDGSAAVLRHAVSHPDDAPAWLFEDVDTIFGTGGGCALSVGAGGDAHVAYVAEDDLNYATDASGDWELWTVSEDVDAVTSIDLDTSGLPHMSFRSFRDTEVSPGVFEREFSPYYARQLGAGGDFETSNPDFRLFDDGSGGMSPYADIDWYSEVSSIVLDSSDYPLVLFSDSAEDTSGLGRVPNWAEGISELDENLFGHPVGLALGTDDQIHAAGALFEKYVEGSGFVTTDQLIYATHPGGAFPASNGWSYYPVEVVGPRPWDPESKLSVSLALDTEGESHFAYRDTTGGVYVLRYLKVVLDDDGVFSQSSEIVYDVFLTDVGRSAEIAVDSSNQVHIGFFEDQFGTAPAVRYARQIECPGPMPSVSPWRSVFYQLPQIETFYVTNIGVGDLEISSIEIDPGSVHNATEGDWHLVDCPEDHPFDFLEGDTSEPTSVDFTPPVVLGEGEFGVVCVGFDPTEIRPGMRARLDVYSGAEFEFATLRAGGAEESSDDGCGGCDGCDDCAMSSPDGDLPIGTLLAFSAFVCGVLLWRAARLRG